MTPGLRPRRTAAWTAALLASALAGVMASAADAATPFQSPQPSNSPRAVGADLHTNVAQLFSGGRWCRGALQGSYRVLLSTGNGRDTRQGLLVQFLPSRDDEGTATASTVPIAELSGTDVVLSGVRVVLPPSAACSDLLVRGHITHTLQGTRTRERFDLHVNQFSGYEIVFDAD